VRCVVGNPERPWLAKELPMQEKDRDYDVLLSVLIVGNTGVGKTCLAVRYAKGSFASDETPTNETSYLGPVFQEFGTLKSSLSRAKSLSSFSPSNLPGYSSLMD